LPDIKEKQAAVDFAQMLLKLINQPFLIDDREIFLTASIGIAFYPLDDVEIDQLLEQAKQAMKYGQQQGGNQYKLYTTALKLMSSSGLNNLFILRNRFTLCSRTSRTRTFLSTAS
jgi:predicted signal transduction protein with EAL and GGDEF domain